MLYRWLRTTWESGFSESDIEFDVVAAKDDSKFIVKCKAVSDEAQEMYELVYDRDICFYGVEFGNASGQYFTTIGESERDVKDKMRLVGERMKRYCKQCGRKLDDGELFCTACGAKYEENDTELRENSKN